MVSSRNRYRCIMSSELGISVIKTCQLLHNIIRAFYNNDCFPFRYWRFCSRESILFHSSKNKIRPDRIKEMLRLLPESILLCTNSIWVYFQFKELVKMSEKEELQLNFNQFQTAHKTLIQERYDTGLSKKWLHDF
jgi:hypothetical protein